MAAIASVFHDGWQAQLGGVRGKRAYERAQGEKVTQTTPILEFKLLLADLEPAHQAFKKRLATEAPTLVDDYDKLAALTWRVIVAALDVEASVVSSR